MPAPTNLVELTYRERTAHLVDGEQQWDAPSLRSLCGRSLPQTALRQNYSDPVCQTCVNAENALSR